MGMAANGPHPLSDIAPRAPLSNILEITPGLRVKRRKFLSNILYCIKGIFQGLEGSGYIIYRRE